jgi:hypothetical protein
MSRPVHEDDDLTSTSLPAHLEDPANGTSVQGWRGVFGQARSEEVEPIDAVVAAELESVDPAEWR